MNCTNCGYNNAPGTIYCGNCGNPLSVNNGMNQIGSVTFSRKSSFVGCVMPFDIFIDNVYIKSLGNGETVTIPVYYGQHQINIKFTPGEGAVQMITIDDAHRNFNIATEIKMGFFVSKAKIVSVTCYN